MNNPLASKKQSEPTQHPAHAHAQVWNHVQSMPHHEVAGGIDSANYTLPILGALANNPKTNRKDVIKAAADAAGAGKIAPSMAVSLISEMPDDPNKLQGWLKGLYAYQLTALVHMKARAMPDQQQAGVPQQ